MSIEKWEVSEDGENWQEWLGSGQPASWAQGGRYRYVRLAEPSQPVIGHVTPLQEVRATTVEQLADELRGEARARERTVAPPEHILQFFAYEHLPMELAQVSAPFCDLAAFLVQALPRNPERTVALRKLLEAKDAAVRARVAK